MTFQAWAEITGFLGNGLASQAESASMPIPDSNSPLGRRRLLHRLGYLRASPADINTARPISDDESARFRLAEQAMLADCPADWPGIGSDDGIDAYALLADALAFDGDPLPISLPRWGDRPSLASRIIQARLFALGASYAEPGRPFSEEDDLALMSIGHWLMRPEEILSAYAERQRRDGDRAAVLRPILALLGNADALLGALRARDPTGFVVTSSWQGHAFQDAGVRPRTSLHGAFAEPFTALDDFFSAADPSPPLFVSAHDGDVRRAMEDNSNALGLRLIQIKLQQAGHYGGLIDGIFGPQSWRALQSAARMENVAVDSSAALGNLCRSLRGSNHIAITLGSPLTRLFLATSQGEDRGTETAGFRNYLETSSQSIQDGADQLMAAVAEPQAHPDEAPDTGVFRSIRRVFAGAVRAVEGFFQAVGKMIARVVEPLMDLVRWLRGLATPLHAALQRLTRPLRRFILCEPMGGDGVFSQCGHDRDMALVVFKGAEASAGAHLAELRADVANFETLGRVLVIMWHLASGFLAGPGGWIRLAITLWREVPALLSLGQEATATG